MQEILINPEDIILATFTIVALNLVFFFCMFQIIRLLNRIFNHDKKSRKEGVGVEEGSTEISKRPKEDRGVPGGGR